jgi:hypothetical protein
MQQVINPVMSIRAHDNQDSKALVKYHIYATGKPMNERLHYGTNVEL